jgi:hypothetical protein
MSLKTTSCKAALESGYATQLSNTMTPSKNTPNPRIAEDQRVVQIFPEQRDIFKQNKRVFRLLLHNLTKLQ